MSMTDALIAKHAAKVSQQQISVAKDNAAKMVPNQPECTTPPMPGCIPLRMISYK